MFVSDLFDPNWHAYVDGERENVLRSNWTFRSIFLEEGEHIVEFRYEPFSFMIGSILTSIGILGILFDSLIIFRKHKKNQ